MVCVVVAARTYSDPPQPGDAGGPPPRLNLLLTDAGWQTESWVELLPQLLSPMGVRAHRVNSGRQATDLIRCTRIHIAVVDLGLPLHPPGSGVTAENDEGGPRLLEILARLETPPPTVVVKRARTRRDDCREIAAALRAGAFAVVDRPRGANDLEVMLDVFRRCLQRFYQGRWPTVT